MYASLAVLGNKTEFVKAVVWLAENLSFDLDIRVNLFEVKALAIYIYVCVYIYRLIMIYMDGGRKLKYVFIIKHVNIFGHDFCSAI